MTVKLNFFHIIQCAINMQSPDCTIHLSILWHWNFLSWGPLNSGKRKVHNNSDWRHANLWCFTSPFPELRWPSEKLLCPLLICSKINIFFSLQIFATFKILKFFYPTFIFCFFTSFLQTDHCAGEGGASNQVFAKPRQGSLTEGEGSVQLTSYN